MVPPATRASRPGWRDPRLWIGIAIVAVSVVVGARVLASADDTVQVWVLADDAAQGQQLSEADLEVRRVRFADDADLDRYFTADDVLPDDLTLDRPVGAGELLPRSAVADGGGDDGVVVSVGVSPLTVPDSLVEGSQVDVYVLPGAGGGRPQADGPALTGVRVVSVAALDDSLATGSEAKVDLAVAPGDVEGFYAVLGASDTPTVRLSVVGP
ncbi:flagellar protein FlgA [Nocardioides marinquilinus]|uniref:Flagellar protein FlgA n=1 Tax=Nocardioides marinquilinus TaxID=1210400 RepID=A0ABP9PIT2_9ACTN